MKEAIVSARSVNLTDTRPARSVNLTDTRPGRRRGPPPTENVAVRAGRRPPRAEGRIDLPA